MAFRSRKHCRARSGAIWECSSARQASRDDMKRSIGLRMRGCRVILERTPVDEAAAPPLESIPE